PRTLIENVQLVCAASVASDSVTLVAPEAAVIVPPPHDPVSPGGFPTTIPDGRLSLNATLVSGTSLIDGFVIVKFKDVVPFRGMLGAPNDIAIAGGSMTTTSAVAALPVPPSAEVTASIALC